MEIGQIKNGRALKRALAAPRFLLFKHSDRCGVSTHALGAYLAFAADHPQVPAGWVDVRAHRPLSNRITEATGIRHASPQAVLIVDGTAVWSASHFDITHDALGNAIRAFS